MSNLARGDGVGRQDEDESIDKRSDHKRDNDRAISELVGYGSVKASAPAQLRCIVRFNVLRNPTTTPLATGEREQSDSRTMLAQPDDHAAPGQREHFFQERKMIAPFGIQ